MVVQIQTFCGLSLYTKPVKWFLFSFIKKPIRNWGTTWSFNFLNHNHLYDTKNWKRNRFDILKLVSKKNYCSECTSVGPVVKMAIWQNRPILSWLQKKNSNNLNLVSFQVLHEQKGKQPIDIQSWISLFSLELVLDSDIPSRPMLL